MLGCSMSPPVVTPECARAKSPTIYCISTKVHKTLLKSRLYSTLLKKTEHFHDKYLLAAALSWGKLKARNQGKKKTQLISAFWEVSSE